MASVWIKTRRTKDGGKRYRVEYRPGGRDTRTGFAGSFRTKRLAVVRAGWVENELAAGPVFDAVAAAAVFRAACLDPDASHSGPRVPLSESCSWSTPPRAVSV